MTRSGALIDPARWIGLISRRNSASAPFGSPYSLIRRTPRTGPRPSSSDRKSTRLNSSHVSRSYAVFCLKKKKKMQDHIGGLEQVEQFLRLVAAVVNSIIVAALLFGFHRRTSVLFVRVSIDACFALVRVL